MRRHYYISTDLDDLEQLESQLEASGIGAEQIHVLSDNAAEVSTRRLHSVDSLSKLDIFYSGALGLFAGLVMASIILGLSYSFALPSVVGWIPVMFLSIIALGFCTWEGGLWGVQKTNRLFVRFQQELKNGMHVFFVDARENEEEEMEKIVSMHSNLQLAGSGAAPPEWVVRAHRSWNKFTGWAP